MYPCRRSGGQPPTTRTSRGKRVSRSTRPAAASSSDEVLDPDARLALEVDARARPRRPSGWAAASRRRARPRDGASWVARPMPCPVPWPKCSPWPAAVDDVAGDARRSPGRSAASPSGRCAPRPTRAPRSRPPGRAPRARRSPGRAPSARRRTASGSCRCDSRRPGPRSRTAGPRRSRTGRSPGAPCGSAASGPARQATSKASASAPPVRISHSSRSARSRLGHARPDLGQQRGERPVGDRAGGRDPLDLGRLLGRPVGLDPALDGHELDVRRGRREPSPDAHATRTRPRPRRVAPRARPAAPASAPAGRCTASTTRASGASRRAWIV